MDDVTDKRFVNSTSSGILLTLSHGAQSGIPRWGKITHLGPKVDPDLHVGEHILIEAGKWTVGFTFNNQRYWKTDDSYILGVSDEVFTTF